MIISIIRQNRTEHGEESLEKQNRAVFVFFCLFNERRGEEGETTRKIQLFLFDWLSFFYEKKLLNESEPDPTN